MISERLLRAPDLVSRCEYEAVGGRRRIKARVCSSKSLGLEEREEILSQAETASESSQGKEATGRRSRRAAQTADGEQEKE